MKYIRKSEMATALTIFTNRVSAITFVFSLAFETIALSFRIKSWPDFAALLCRTALAVRLNMSKKWMKQIKNLIVRPSVLFWKFCHWDAAEKKTVLEDKKYSFYFSIKLMLSEILFHIYMFCDPESCEWNLRFLKRSCLSL